MVNIYVDVPEYTLTVESMYLTSETQTSLTYE